MNSQLSDVCGAKNPKIANNQRSNKSRMQVFFLEQKWEEEKRGEKKNDVALELSYFFKKKNSFRASKKVLAGVFVNH